MKIIQHQFWQLVALIALLFLLNFLSHYDHEALNGQLFGISTSTWFIAAIVPPIIHQLYVLFVWRLELHYKWISKTFGSKGFKLYKGGFIILILARPITLIFLAISNGHTLHLNSFLSYLIAIALFVPTVYLIYSIKKYFGLDKVVGVDHFEPERARNEPFVKKGIFKYSSNAMYKYGFFLMWIPGFLFFSKAALLIALYSHLFIWAHYYCTEKPDIEVIYGVKS